MTPWLRVLVGCALLAACRAGQAEDRAANLLLATDPCVFAAATAAPSVADWTTLTNVLKKAQTTAAARVAAPTRHGWGADDYNILQKYRAAYHETCTHDAACAAVSLTCKQVLLHVHEWVGLGDELEFMFGAAARAHPLRSVAALASLAAMAHLAQQF